MDTTTASPSLAFDAELRGETGRGDAILRLHGELDLASVADFERQLSALESRGPASLTIDLRDLVFMDSTGLHALLAARQRAIESDRTLTLVPGPSAVRRVFTTTGTDTLFTFTADDLPRHQRPRAAGRRRR